MKKLAINTKAFLMIPLLVFMTSASKMTDGYQVGDTAQNFKLKNINGQMIALDDFNSEKGVIVIFTCNSCPYSVKYEDRIIDLNNKFSSQGFPVVAINPNDPERKPQDSFENMKVRAEDKGFTFPYLIDETQEIARAFGAKVTPQVFLLKNENNSFKVAYIGAIDDNYRGADLAQKKYVEDAIQELTGGKDVSNSFTKGIGCSIKWREI